MAKYYDPLQDQFGKNRGKKIKTGIAQQVSALSKQQLDPETVRAYQMTQEMANMGLTGATKALYAQGAGRAMSSALGAASAGRGTLKSLGTIMGQADQSNLQLAAREEEARRNNMLMGIRGAEQFGRQRLELEQYKQRGLFNYYTGRLDQRRRNLKDSLLLGGQVVGTIVGAALGNPAAGAGAAKGAAKTPGVV